MKLSEIASLIHGEVIGNGNVEIRDVAKIEDAQQGHITFLASLKYAKYLKDSKASAIITPRDFEAAGDIPIVRTENPYYAFMQTIALFHPPAPLIEKGIHPSAVIGERTELGKDLSIGPHVFIGRECRIGDGTVLMPSVVIGDGVHIGDGCVIHANVSLREKVVIGNRVVIHNGAVIGSDGFGFAPEAGIYHKIPQIGTVVIEDDVEIGANTTIDRATMGETIIKKGAKLDNLIQVGHNCTIGENTVIAGQAGLSGSTHIGKGVRVGGQVGFAGHLDVGDGAAVGAQSGVNKSIPPGLYVFGYPARPHMEEFRIQAVIKKLPQLQKELMDLKKKIRKSE